ncbi:vitamin B12 ABC transporter ATP-binding protein BtuD [Vibrio sp. Of14-4]|uniref:vitamin B12 ABC transporter ATP-binding protein BtuD n=1 Tax=Vibrio sp. Of14-4 TaxID=2724878 RepID=UPI001EF23B03|nr:vitamin B12 ABC transporter ATP-binding protein BtuD [Vibrio sp. Of14-4]MCG7488282.1 vitamin B12 ABC transporter ATP-binding protein BtuD [Vibrio sp. Of14-4]
MIRIDNLSLGIRLLPLSFSLNKGEVLHVIGPNGSGKSTLLACVAGLLDFQGNVCIDDIKVGESSLETLAISRAFLSQNDRPAFNLDVSFYLSLSLPAAYQKLTTAAETVVQELTELLEITDKLHRSIHELSGGEWQRVRLCAICLQVWPSLNPDAKLLILDEPAAALDIGQEVFLYRLIRKIADMGISVIMSNHDLNRTIRNADCALLLEQGVMQAFGSVKEVCDPDELSRVFKTRVELAQVKGEPVLVFT